MIENAIIGTATETLITRGTRVKMIMAATAEENATVVMVIGGITANQEKDQKESLNHALAPGSRSHSKSNVAYGRKHRRAANCQNNQGRMLLRRPHKRLQVTLSTKK